MRVQHLLKGVYILFVHLAEEGFCFLAGRYLMEIFLVLIFLKVMCNFNQIIVIIQDFNYPTRITCVISVEIVITEIKDIILILRIWSKRVHENGSYVTRQITLTTMIISK